MVSFFVKKARSALNMSVSRCIYQANFPCDDNSLLRNLESCNIVNVKQCKVDKY